MSLRIVYSQNFSIQPKYRKKTGITQDEHDRNVRRLKMFDRVQAVPEAGQDIANLERTYIDKTDTLHNDTRRTTNDEPAAGSSVDRLPSYSELEDERICSPPAYSAGPSIGEGH
jgi:hypothetical protein